MAGSGHMNSPFDFSFTAGTNGMQTSPTPFGQASAGLAQNGGSLPILPMSAPPAFANMPSHGSLPVRGSRRRSPPVQTPPASHGTPTFFQRSATTGYGAQRDGRGMTPPIGEMAQMNMAQSQQYNYVPPQDGEPMAKLRKSAIEEDVRAAAFAYGKAATAKQEADEAVQRYKWSSSLVAELMEDEKIDDAGLLGQETTYNVADYGSIDGSCTMCAFGSVEVGDKCPQCGRVAGAPSKTSAASGTQGQQMLAAAALRVAAGDAGLNNHGSGTSGQDAYGRSESGAESGTGNNSDGPGHGAHGGTALAATWVAVQEGFDAGLLLNGQQNARQL